MANDKDKIEDVPLETLEDVRRELAANYNAWRKDRLDGQDARVAKEQLLAIKDVMAQTVLEQKLIEIEEIVAKRAGGVVPLKRAV